MCDQDQLTEMGVSRRQFGTLGAVAGLGAAFAPWATACAQGAGGLVEADVSFAAPGGTLDGFFVHPAEGKHPGVILWPDIAGLRDAKKVMARRLASSGYSVLVVNPFYRSAPAPQFKDFADFRDNPAFGGVLTIGLAITEPVWAEVRVNGVPRRVLIQAFERRVLTYTPSNDPAFQVEYGNIGRHYYTWRYQS